MTGIVRRTNLLTVLLLLVSGLLGPLAAAQGVTCVRAYAPVQEAGPATGATFDDHAGVHEGRRAISAPHQHDRSPLPDAASASSASCGVAAIPSEQRLPSPAATARQLLHIGELPPASLLIDSLFRPPRLS